MDQLSSIIELLKGAGPATIFAVMWWLERTERIKIAEQLMSNIKTMGDMNTAWLKVLDRHSGSGD